jgi:hypothetical protein
MNNFLKKPALLPRFVKMLHCNLSTALMLLILSCFHSAFATPTTPTSDFIDNNDGTVTHKLTGLVWMRCSMGQTWDAITSNCIGTAATYAWDEAVPLKSDFAGKIDWRLPNENELATIIEFDRVAPAINTTIFPNTQTSTWTWSSSPTVKYSSYAWNVYFYGGRSLIDNKKGKGFARLVRGGQCSLCQLSLDMNSQHAIALNFAQQYDDTNAKSVALINFSNKDIQVSNVIVSDAENYWVNLFADDKSVCRPLMYSQSVKNFTIPAQSSCKISVGFSPFNNLTANKPLIANITLKAVINNVSTDKTISVTGLGRAQRINFYDNSHLWGQRTWAVSELKNGNPPINTLLVGATNHYSGAKYWYGGVVNALLQKTTASVGDVVVFAQNSESSAGHVGVIIQTSPVLTMLSMNDVPDQNGVSMGKWSVRPVDWYPRKHAIWQPLITGFNSTDATRHYGFINWNVSY